MSQHKTSTVLAQFDVHPFTIFRPKGTQNWSVRFTLKGAGIQRISLKTSDYDMATKRARKVYADALDRLETGMVMKPVRLAVHIVNYMSEVTGTKQKQGYRKTVLERYLMDFMGDLTPEALTDRKIYEYQKWRERYWMDGPGNNIKKIRYIRDGISIFRPVSEKERKPIAAATKVKENTVLKEFFVWLKMNGHLKTIPELTKVKPDSKLSRRPSFEDHELNLFMYHLDNLPSTRTNDVFKCFVKIMVAGGFRDTEALHLKWTSIKDMNHKDRISVYVHGKSKQRMMVPNPEIVDALQELKLITGQDEYIFSYENGERIQSFDKVMNKVLKESGLTYNIHGIKRTCYSFRHYYITKKLQENINIHFIARNVGNSVDMIEKHYSHLTVADLRAKLFAQ